MNSMLVFAGLIIIIVLPFHFVRGLWKNEQFKRRQAELKQRQREFTASFLAKKDLAGCRLNSSERTLLANEIFQRQQLNMTLGDCFVLLDQLLPEKEPE